MNRSGQVIQDRFKSPVLQNDDQLLTVMFYHDLNMFRTARQTHPDKDTWSSYAHYAHGTEDPLITEPACYTALGDTPKQRQAKYRQMVTAIIRNDEAKVKQNYSKALYIGDPLWVKNRYEKIQEIKRLKKMAYLKRQHQFLNRLRE